jgi:hypothetical protein
MTNNVEARIAAVGGWRAETLARIRQLILAVDGEMEEALKWRGVPVWSRHGIICTGESYKDTVKLTFAHGAELPDPAQLFNASLTGGTRRAIDIREGQTVPVRAFQALVRAAIARNSSSRSSLSPRGKKKVVLLSGGNPQIAKADGDAPVQAYIAAMPGWKSEIGRKLDALIARAVPGVRKAVKWNSPFYGVEGQGWFVTFHVLTRYVKVTFFRGALLKHPPNGCTEKSGEARWLDIYEADGLDEKQMAAWMKQAAALPGWDPGKR